MDRRDSLELELVLGVLVVPVVPVVPVVSVVSCCIVSLFLVSGDLRESYYNWFGSSDVFDEPGGVSTMVLAMGVRKNLSAALLPLGEGFFKTSFTDLFE